MISNLWQVDFLLDDAATGAKPGVVAHVTLRSARAVMLVLHAWNAAAGEWAINDKGVALNVAGRTVQNVRSCSHQKALASRGF